MRLMTWLRSHYSYGTTVSFSLILIGKWPGSLLDYKLKEETFINLDGKWVEWKVLSFGKWARHFYRILTLTPVQIYEIDVVYSTLWIFLYYSIKVLHTLTCANGMLWNMPRWSSTMAQVWLRLFWNVLRWSRLSKTFLVLGKGVTCIVLLLSKLILFVDDNHKDCQTWPFSSSCCISFSVLLIEFSTSYCIWLWPITLN